MNINSSLIIRKSQAFICLLFTLPAFTQETTIVETETDRWHKIVIPGKKYARSSFHNWLWGTHYRKEWATPVKVNVIYLDSVYGGLTPVEKAGSRQTKGLRLENKNKKQYVLRSVDKSYKRALPEIFKGTFIESIANDQVSVAHPYAPFTVAPMAEAAKIYHTNPQLIFLPQQPKLGEFNTEYSNQLYLLEERPDDDQSDAPHFGNSKDVKSTEKMMEEISGENSHRVDQETLLRARLFDMFLSDWSRHEDQWRWATFKQNDLTIYKPIPRDRDQSYTKYDGLLVRMLAPSAAVGYLQSFDYTIKDINKYNFQARHLDRRFLNEPSRNTWIAIAKELQQLLTDLVIESSVKQLPPEVFPISGPEIIAKLRSRRDHLVEYANEYYSILTKEVEIVGSKQNEYFEITKSDTGEVIISMYNADKNGNKLGNPLYTRIFFKDETKEIRIYGLDGNDNFNIAYGGSAINIRIIGGPKKDVYAYSLPSANKKIAVYDDAENEFKTAGKIKYHLSGDSAIHSYNYYAHKFDKIGLKPGISYNTEDRIYITLGYQFQKQQWRKSPFGYQHDLNLNYSLTQKAFSIQYKSIFNQLIGKWNVGLLANYDFVRDLYYAGTGNNSVKYIANKKFYKLRSREFNSGISFIRPIDSSSAITISGFYKTIKVLKDSGKFVAVIQAPLDPSVFDQHNFSGAIVEYAYEKINDKVLPTRGIHFSSSISYTNDLKDKNSYTRFTGIAGFYLPLLKSVTLAVKTGAATVIGQPGFYELNKIGGGNTLRGYLKYRFYGKTSFYNQNELQWNMDIKSWLMNGKIGLLAFFDNGRVWQPGEVSDIWHTGYGFGITLAPFNKYSITASYGMSKESNLAYLRVGKLF
ncbi:MAG: hypothetical protein JWN83_1773 [Chitinophagaceae bacterium]|nr:hypothetical protein [Chitinophagaceae bacterium]